MRQRNPFAKRYTLETFSEKYFNGAEVPRTIQKEFWSDFNYAFVGGLNKYIKETSEEV